MQRIKGVYLDSSESVMGGGRGQLWQQTTDIIKEWEAECSHLRPPAGIRENQGANEGSFFPNGKTRPCY